jgi:hypothetical protein
VPILGSPVPVEPTVPEPDDPAVLEAVLPDGVPAVSELAAIELWVRTWLVLTSQQNSLLDALLGELFGEPPA